MSTTLFCGYKYQPRALASNTSTLATVPVPLHFSALANSIAVFFPLLVDPINPKAGEDNRGKHAVEEIPEEDMPMNQRLRHMR